MNGQTPRFSLDQSQEVAVNSNSQFLQILGYPGSGKTLVLARRIARLIKGGADPSSILTLTLTNNSLFSLRTAVRNALLEFGGAESCYAAQDQADRVLMYNYHTFSSNLIAGFGCNIGIPGNASMTDFLDLHNIRFSVKTRRGSKISQKEVVIRQKEMMNMFNVYDFDSALEYAFRVLMEEGHSVQYLILDEFQDSTRAQWMLAKALSAKNPSLHMTVAGDPDQEIFAFQEDHFTGAFQRMREDFRETEVLELLHNYRSSPQIVDTVMGITAKGCDTKSAKQVTTAMPSGPSPRMVLVQSSEDEMNAVASKIKETLDHSMELSPGDVAVLVRTQANVSDCVRGLRERNIPASTFFSVRGIGTKKIPNVAITLLKWANEPKDFYLLQLLHNQMAKYITEGDLDHLADNGQLNGSKLISHALNPAKESHKLKNPIKYESPLMQELMKMKPKRYRNFFTTHWLPSIREKLLAAYSVEQIIAVLNGAMIEWPRQTGLMFRPTKTDLAQWQYFLEELKTNESNSKVFAQNPAERGSILRSLILKLFDATHHEDEEDMRPDRVAVLTIHSAKSRQWPVVLLPSMEKPNLFGFPPMDTPEESRRLQYVAASRAQKELTFFNSGAITRGSRNYFVPVSHKKPDKFSLWTSGQALTRNNSVFRPPQVLKKVRTIL